MALLFGSLAQADFDTYCSNGNCTINADEISNNTITFLRLQQYNAFNNLGTIEVAGQNNGIDNWGIIQNLTNSGKIIGRYGILNLESGSIGILTNLGTITKANIGIEDKTQSHTGYVRLGIW